MSPEPLVPRRVRFMKAALALVPISAALALHFSASRIFVSAPLNLSLYGSVVLSLLVVWLGLKARYSLEATRIVTSSILLVSVLLGTATIWLPLSQLSEIQVRAVVCMMPLIWSALWALYYLCGDAPRESYLKLLAALSAGYIGVSVVVLVWYMGGINLSMNRSAVERFPYTFGIWDTVPVSRHMFMVFDMRWSQYEKQLCYHGYSPLFTIPHYLAFKLIRWYSGIPYEKGIRLSAFAYGIVFSFVIPLCTSFRMHFQRATKASFLLWLYVPMILVLSIPDLWTGLLEMDGDNSFPLSALGTYAVTCLIGRALEKREPSSWPLTFIALALFSVFTPVSAAILGAVVLMLFVGLKRHELLLSAVVLLLASVGTYCTMSMLAKVAGLTLQGSSIAARSGFTTGGMGSLQAAWAALVHPVEQYNLRPYSFIWIGLFSALTAIVANCFVTSNKASSNLIFLMLAPLALDLVMFTQSHSVHPYLYDIPMSVLSALSLYWVASSDEGEPGALVCQLRPWVALLFICGAIGNLMALRAFFLNS